MKVVIIGAGEVGYHVIGALYRESVDITAVDSDPAVLGRLKEEFNIATLLGNASDGAVLEAAGVAEAELFMAVTNSDETNIISCLMAGQQGAARRIARVKSIDLGHQATHAAHEALGIDLVINPYEVAADHLANLTANPQSTDYNRFMGDQVILVRVPIKENSPLAGRRVQHFGQSSGLNQALIALIQRAGQSFIAHGEHRIEARDHVYFFCGRDQLTELYRYLKLPVQPARRVFINGGGHIGYTLARRLETKGVDVRILEINKERCDLLSQWLDSTLILNSDGCDSNALKAENIERADYFISVTADDEINVTASLLAKQYGAQHVCALVKQPELLPVLQQTTMLDVAFSPRLLTARRILRLVRGANLSSFFAFPNTDIEILELDIQSGMACEQRTLSRLELPQGVLVGAVQRGGHIFLPRGEDRLMGGDRILIIQKRRNRRATNRMFLAQNEADQPASIGATSDVHRQTAS